MRHVARTLFAVLILLHSICLAETELVDRVVASIGDVAITLFDVEKEGAALFRQITDSTPPEKREQRLFEARKKVLESLVDKVLLLREAKRRGLDVADEEVDAAIENIKTENNIDQEGLIKALTREGLNYESYRDEVRGQILRARVVDKYVKGNVSISDEDVEIYYEQNRGDFVSNEEVRASHILFTLPDGADAEYEKDLLAQALAVARKARDGEDFGELAKKYSQGPSAPEGGDLGFFGRDDMVKEFSDAAFSLKEGETSDPVKTKFGFHIIKLFEKRGGDRLPPDQVKAKIKTMLFNREIEKGIKDFVRELKEKGDIRIRL